MLRFAQHDGDLDDRVARFVFLSEAKDVNNDYELALFAALIDAKCL